MNYELINELFCSYYSARKNKRSTLNQLGFEIEMERHIVELGLLIESKKYKPERSICFVVDKHVKREIFAASFKDRVVHHLIYRQISPLFEKLFIEDSYSCRKGKGTLFGVERLEHHIRSCSENYTKYCYVLKLDIQGYFMSINKHLLHNQIKNVLNKKWEQYCATTKHCSYYLNKETLFYLLEQILFCNVTDGCIIKGSRDDWNDLPSSKSLFHAKNNCGLPIGNLTSQLFSNIYLNSFDQWIKREVKIKHYGRYVDDFYLIHNDKEYLKSIIKPIKEYLSSHLELTLHPKKIYLQNTNKGVAFLGFVVKPYRRYTGNRTIKNFHTTLLKYKQNESEILNLPQSINSYLGIMRHSKSLGIRRKMLLSHRWIFDLGCVNNRYTRYRFDDG